MRAIRKIQQVIASGILHEDLMILPTRGATVEEITEEEELIGRPLSAQHTGLLEEWNGIGLEVLRLFGCGTDTGEIGRLVDCFAIDSIDRGVIVIGSDSSGFAYLEDRTGAIYSLETSEQRLNFLASDLESFICEVVFGSRAERFAGKDWKDELREFGLL